jgi:hypothetical protein
MRSAGTSQSFETVGWDREPVRGEQFDLRAATNLMGVFGVSLVCWVAIGVAIWRLIG